MIFVTPLSKVVEGSPNGKSKTTFSNFSDIEWTLPLLATSVGKHRVFDSATHALILYRMKTKGHFFKLCEFFLSRVKFQLSI